MYKTNTYKQIYGTISMYLGFSVDISVDGKIGTGVPRFVN